MRTSTPSQKYRKGGGASCSVTINRENYEVIRDFAEKQDRSISWILRKAVLAGMKSEFGIDLPGER